MHNILPLFPLFLGCVLAVRPCPCGWRVPDSNDTYQHRIFLDFVHYGDTAGLDLEETAFGEHWMIYNFTQLSDNLDIRLHAHYTPENVQVKNGGLTLTQRAYSVEDMQQKRAISVAGIQTKQSNILHGTFRAVMKLSESKGGSCASLFWYHNDRSEIDIEAVTPGTSLVNNSINYTNHPSLDVDGNLIPNATLSVPISGKYNDAISTFREHRFDSGPDGVGFYLDGQLMKTDAQNIAKEGGSLQLKLWADGNKWWSGRPSITDVQLSISSIIAYYNLSSTFDDDWQRQCQQSGGSNKKTVCEGKLKTEPRPSAFPNSGSRLSILGLINF